MYIDSPAAVLLAKMMFACLTMTTEPQASWQPNVCYLDQSCTHWQHGGFDQVVGQIWLALHIFKLISRLCEQQKLGSPGVWFSGVSPKCAIGASYYQYCRRQYMKPLEWDLMGVLQFCAFIDLAQVFGECLVQTKEACNWYFHGLHPTNLSSWCPVFRHTRWRYEQIMFAQWHKNSPRSTLNYSKRGMKHLFSIFLCLHSKSSRIIPGFHILVCPCKRKKEQPQ